MAGAGYKLFSTGDVLTASDVNTYLQQQTVMVFADASARTTALSGVLAEGMMSYLQDTDTVYVYNGAAWVGVSQDQTPLTTKGDLFTYSTADARLPVGNNGETLVADSSTSTGLRYNPLVNQNFAVNGSFDFWQRGTSFTGTGDYYTADRWQGFRSAVAAGGTWSRQSASIDGFTYAIRAQRNSGNTSTATLIVSTSFESLQVENLQGQFLTVSFWARRGANYSAASNSLDAELLSGTGTDGNVVNGFTNQALVGQNASSVTLTTSWQRFSVTTSAAIGSTVTQLGLRFRATPVGTAGADDWFEITGVQIEVGQVVTAWKRAGGGTLAGELAACQRYYYRQTALGNYTVFATGGSTGSTNARFAISYPVQMRVAPTSLDYSTLAVAEAGGSVIAATSAALDGVLAVLVNVSSGLTQYRSNFLYSNNSTSAYIGFSAEL